MNIAVLDTETNIRNEVFSIGIVIADSENYQPLEMKYYILLPESSVDGMYSYALKLRGQAYRECNRGQAMQEILSLFARYGVISVFAFNATFDYGLLPELSTFYWYDIMQVAAYRRYNDKIPENAEFTSSGRLKRGYGVQGIMRILTDNNEYREVHNALIDAVDELRIMRLLGQKLEVYKQLNCQRNII